MLPIAYRLPKEQIRVTLRKGKRVYVTPLLGYLIQNDITHTRVAIIVGKKAARLASKRNRMKRLLRQSLRTILLTINSHNDLVIVVQEASKEFTQENVDKMARSLLEKAHLV